jgi:hypothetical protein
MKESSPCLRLISRNLTHRTPGRLHYYSYGSCLIMYEQHRGATVINGVLRDVLGLQQQFLLHAIFLND